MLDEWVVHGVVIRNARFFFGARNPSFVYYCNGGCDIYKGRLYLGWTCFGMVDRVLNERSFFVQDRVLSVVMYGIISHGSFKLHVSFNSYG